MIKNEEEPTTLKKPKAEAQVLFRFQTNPETPRILR